MRPRTSGRPALFAKIDRKIPVKACLLIGEERPSKYYPGKGFRLRIYPAATSLGTVGRENFDNCSFSLRFLLVSGLAQTALLDSE
jgi:hypothetical protein